MSDYAFGYKLSSISEEVLEAPIQRRKLHFNFRRI